MFNVFKCARCLALFQREDGIKLCGPCLQSIVPPATESAEAWNGFLAMSGESVSRGKFIGTKGIVYAPISPLNVQGDSLESIPDSFDLEAAVENQQLLDFFLAGSAREVGRAFGLHPEAVQRLRSEYFGIDREEIETARKLLGYSKSDWQHRKLGISLVKARADSERKRMAA